MANRIPQTSLKLSQQLALVGYHQVDDTANPFDTSNWQNALATLSSIKFFGATNRFKVSQDADNQSRRGIDSPIESFATLPGPVTTTLEMDRVVLNTEDAMSAFQFTSGNIAFQTRPLVIIEFTYASDAKLHNVVSKANLPGGLANIAKTVQGGAGALLTAMDLARTPVYSGCRVASSGIEYKLDGAQAVVQNVTMTVARVSPAVAVAFSDLEQTLLQNFPIVTRAIGLVTGQTGIAQGRLGRL
jgi:hypothetical protein